GTSQTLTPLFPLRQHVLTVVVVLGLQGQDGRHGEQRIVTRSEDGEEDQEIGSWFRSHGSATAREHTIPSQQRLPGWNASGNRNERFSLTLDAAGRFATSPQRPQRALLALRAAQKVRTRPAK